MIAPKSLLTNRDDTEKRVLDTYRVLETIKKIRDFMFADLEKTIDLVSTTKGAPNFMLALVLCCYTEFWGKLLNGVSNPEKGELPGFYNDFFVRLGSRYQDLHDRLGRSDTNKIYYEIRCGLAHAYLVEENAKILIEGGHTGIDYDERTKTYTFYIRRYFEDFKFAVNKYIADLVSDADLLEKAKSVVDSKGILLL
jgi:hypothetical protein